MIVTVAFLTVGGLLSQAERRGGHGPGRTGQARTRGAKRQTRQR